MKYPPSGKSYKDALVNDLCFNNHIYYYVWFTINGFITLMRCASLFLMIKG